MDLIRYQITDEMGQVLPGEHFDVPLSWESTEEAIQRLREDFGGRLVKLKVEPLQLSEKPS